MVGGLCVGYEERNEEGLEEIMRERNEAWEKVVGMVEEVGGD